MLKLFVEDALRQQDGLPWILWALLFLWAPVKHILVVEVGLALGRALGHMPVRLKALLRVLSRNNLDIWLIITLVG